MIFKLKKNQTDEKQSPQQMIQDAWMYNLNSNLITVKKVSGYPIGKQICFLFDYVACALICDAGNVLIGWLEFILYKYSRFWNSLLCKAQYYFNQYETFVTYSYIV